MHLVAKKNAKYQRCIIPDQRSNDDNSIHPSTAGSSKCKKKDKEEKCDLSPVQEMLLSSAAEHNQRDTEEFEHSRAGDKMQNTHT